MNIADYLRDSAELAGELDDEGAYLIEIEASPMHLAIVQMLRRMLEMMEEFAGASGKVPAPLRAMGRTIRHLEPVLLEGFVDVPPEQVEAFLEGLITQLRNSIDEAHGVSSSRSNKSPAA